MQLTDSLAITDALEYWVEATTPYCEPRNANVEEEVRFIERTRALLTALKGIPYTDLQEKDLYGDYFTVRRNIIGLSAQFLWNDYTDSNTDEPCDMEWDVHNLLARLIENYHIPEDIRPAYVGNYYEGPKEDAE